MAKKKTTSKSAKPAAKKTAAKPAAAKRAAAPKASRRSGTPTDAEIRKMDKELIKLINQRAAAELSVLKSKEDPRAAMFDPQAEEELWKRLAGQAKTPMPDSAMRAIFREIVSASRQQIRTQRVAYLGPPYSFTHIAAIDKFGTSADLVAVNTIAAVFDEVNRGHADFGIVPIENSTDGRVVDTLDMFQRLPLQICGEVQISVHHNLLSRSARSEINEIYSKPQALSQCRDWLARNMPAARLIEVTSTSTAAQLARDKPGAGAVASRQASVQYGLEIIANNIEDNPNNVTRFAIIGDETTVPTKNDRTALLLHISHSPGALSDSLSAFKKNKINLTWIESFPLRGSENGYLFFLDFEGHQLDPKIKKALAEIEKNAVALRLLGSYPRSTPIE